MKGWKTVKLRDVCRFENGDRGKNYPGRKAFVAEGVPFINAGHLTQNGIDMDAMNFIPREKFDLLGNGKIQEGDILFCLRGSLGKFAVVEGLQEGAIASSLVIVRPGEGVDRKFLAAYFGSGLCVNMIRQFENGAAQPNLSARSLGEFKLPLPPLPEQKRIVAILDEAFAALATARAHAEKNRANARELFESYLNVLFNDEGSAWTECPLADILDRITYGFTNPMPTAEEGPYMVTAKNINGGRIVYEQARRTSREAFETLLTDKSRPRVGDVLLTKDGTLGRLAVVDQENTCVNQSVAVLRPNSRIDPHFLKYLLSSPGYQRRMVEDAGGTTIKHIYITRVDKMKVAFPSLPEQKHLVEKIDSYLAKTENLKCVCQQKLDSISELKQSLLHKAFTGKLSAGRKAAGRALSEAKT